MSSSKNPGSVGHADEGVVIVTSKQWTARASNGWATQIQSRSGHAIQQGANPVVQNPIGIKQGPDA
ncbi:hypothetical protein ACLOJK_041500, partial [Asimina triloba]